jgi:hypothetical protein
MKEIACAVRRHWDAVSSARQAVDQGFDRIVFANQTQHRGVLRSPSLRPSFRDTRQARKPGTRANPREIPGSRFARRGMTDC